MSNGHYDSYQMTFSDLKYLLFGKKKCPNCSGKLQRADHKDSIGKGDVYIGDVDKGVNYRDVEKYKVAIFYQCTACRKTYSIQELSERKG